jgi:hypothetical protein
MSRAVLSSRSAFTLIEIGFSLLILTVSFVAIALAYPTGIKAQRQSRYQIYACSKVMQIVDHLANNSHVRYERQVEANALSENTVKHWPTDLETMFESKNLGLLPVPDEIVRRIDSDNNEIANHVDQGGRLYYVSSMAYEFGSEERTANAAFDSGLADSQSMVFAVLGYAQQNCLPNHPCLAWPYYEFYPAPAQPWEKNCWERNKAAWGSYDEFVALYTHINVDNYGTYNLDKARIEQYILKAEALVVATGISLVGGTKTPPREPLPLPAGGNWNTTDINYFPKPAQILALRYLAHAVQARTALAFEAPAYAWTDLKYYQDCHEVALKWAMRYASANPYDWGAPRPLNRQTSADFPLLQYDLFPTASKPIAANSAGDLSWRIIAPQQPVNYDRARGAYGWFAMLPDNNANLNSSWGDHGHFNLTNRFDPAERTRRIMCWSVDWQAYEDFETLPASSYDSNIHFMDTHGIPVSNERAGYPSDMGNHFIADLSKGFDYTYRPFAPDPECDTEAYKKIYFGVYGLDRNGNRTLDRGLLPKSARIRASTVTHFDYYDPRLIGGLRN